MSPLSEPIPCPNTAGVPLCHAPPILCLLVPLNDPLSTPQGPVLSLPLAPTPVEAWEAASTPLPSPATALLQTFQLPLERSDAGGLLPLLFLWRMLPYTQTSDDEHCVCVCFKDILFN